MLDPVKNPTAASVATIFFFVMVSSFACLCAATDFSVLTPESTGPQGSPLTAEGMKPAAIQGTAPEETQEAAVPSKPIVLEPESGSSASSPKTASLTAESGPGDNAAEGAATAPQLIVAPPLDTVKELFEGAETLSDNGDGSWRVMDISGNHLGDAIAGSGAPAGITGYAGPTPLVLGFGKDGTVKGLNLLSNQETPGFQAMFSAGPFLKSWNGLKPPQALTAEVDTVSGATMSTTSIRETVRALLSEFLKNK